MADREDLPASLRPGIPTGRLDETGPGATVIVFPACSVSQRPARLPACSGWHDSCALRVFMVSVVLGVLAFLGVSVDMGGMFCVFRGNW